MDYDLNRRKQTDKLADIIMEMFYISILLAVSFAVAWPILAAFGVDK